MLCFRPVQGKGRLSSDGAGMTEVGWESLPEGAVASGAQARGEALRGGRFMGQRRVGSNEVERPKAIPVVHP